MAFPNNGTQRAEGIWKKMMSKRYFGGRIEAHMVEVECPYCGAEPGERCETMTIVSGGQRVRSGFAAQPHTSRWNVAKEELLARGDGPNVEGLM